MTDRLHGIFENRAIMTVDLETGDTGRQRGTAPAIDDRHVVTHLDQQSQNAAADVSRSPNKTYFHSGDIN